MASSVFKLIHSEKRNKIRDMNDVRTRASKRLKETRKSQREAILNLHRRVEIKPEVRRKKTEQEETLLRLKTYREEKLKRMEEQKKSQKPPFYSLVRVRHTGGTPFKNKHQTVKNLAVTLPPATRSRTAFQKEFVFKATLSSMDQNGSKQKEVLTIKPSTVKTRKNKENQQPIKSNSKVTAKAAIVTVKAPLIKETPSLMNRKPIVLPIASNRVTRQKENLAPTVTTRPTRQREIATLKNNVIASNIGDGPQKKKTVIKPKSALVSKTVSNAKKEKGISPKNVLKSSDGVADSKKVVPGKYEESNTMDQKIHEEINNLLADKLAERVFIMSPLVTNNLSTRSTRRRPRPSTGNLIPIEAKISFNGVEREKSEENEKTSIELVDESGKIGPEALRTKLEEETLRLNNTADAWSQRHTEDSNSIPEHLKDEILAVVGQTRLLLSDKFQQFRSLIDNALSDHKESAVVIKADDLLGFWEMMYLEVEQLNRKYENLARLAENGWCPVEKLKMVKKGKKKVNEKKPTNSASSKFKEFLKKKKCEDKNNEEFNNTTLQGTPNKKTPSLIRTLNSDRKTRRSSACNITLQKSFLAKAVLSPFVKS